MLYLCIEVAGFATMCRQCWAQGTGYGMMPLADIEWALDEAHQSCPITSPDVLDTDWIPQVAARGWLIIARDSMIIQNRNEIAAVRENKAKMVALNQRDAQTKWGQLEVFMTQRRRIEALIPEPGPFSWRVSRTALTRSRSISLRSQRLPQVSGQPRCRHVMTLRDLRPVASAPCRLDARTVRCRRRVRRAHISHYSAFHSPRDGQGFRPRIRWVQAFRCRAGPSRAAGA